MSHWITSLSQFASFLFSVFLNDLENTFFELIFSLERDKYKDEIQFLIKMF